MKTLHKVLAVVMLGLMVAPAVEAGKGGKKRCNAKTGQTASKKKTRKPKTEEQKAKAKARRDARKAEKAKQANS